MMANVDRLKDLPRSKSKGKDSFRRSASSRQRGKTRMRQTSVVSKAAIRETLVSEATKRSHALFGWRNRAKDAPGERAAKETPPLNSENSVALRRLRGQNEVPQMDQEYRAARRLFIVQYSNCPRDREMPLAAATQSGEMSSIREAGVCELEQCGRTRVASRTTKPKFRVLPTGTEAAIGIVR